MNWKNTAFKYRDIAEQLKKQLDEAGIKTGDIFHTGDNTYWYVPWMVMSKEQERKALEIVCEHIE